jgi:hypothetical protein
MRLSAQLLAPVAYLCLACAFQAPPGRTSRSSLQILSESGSSPSFLDKFPELPGFFSSLKAPDVEDSFLTSSAFEPTPTGLIQQAGRVLAADMGLQDPSLLDDTRFLWIGSAVETPLSKTEYLAAGKFFDLRLAFPDYDYRSHDFRIDENDSNTVRLTCRTTGTMRGELRLRKEVLPPSGKTMRCPPEAVSMTFDRATGKVIKLCTGFAMDRLVGNTNGCTGVLAAAVIAGQPPSDWELYPPVAVVQRVFGRPVAQLKEAESFLAPFPETVMIQLVKGVMATDMGAKDPTLLADGFTYCTPYQGPIRKKAYLEKFAEQEFEGVDPSFSHFRIDPYDPVRVWVDVVLKAPGFEGVPQAMSFTFNEDGFCSRITSGAVMDPSVGNAGGLGGLEGYRYAMGAASPGIVTRPLPRIVGRFRKRTLGLVNGIGVDDYVLPSQRQPKKTARPPARPAPTAPAKPQQFAPKPPAKSVPTLRAPSVVVKKPELTASERQVKVDEQNRKQQAKAREEEAKQRTAAQAEERRRQEETRLADQKRQQEQRQQVSDGAATEAKRKEVEAKRMAQVEAKEAALERKAKQALQAEEDARQKQGESAKAKQQQKELEAKQALQSKEAARREQEEALKTAQKQKELQAKRALQEKDVRREQEEALKAAQKQKELQAKQALQAKEDARRQQETARKAAVEQKQMETQAQARRAEAAKQRKQQEQKKLAIERDQKKMMENEKKRKEAELLKLAQAKARQAQIEAKTVEAENKKREAAELKAAQIAARQKAEDERKAALEEKRKDADQQRKEKAVLDSLASAAPRATIALFGFGGGSEEEEERKAPLPKRTKAIGSKAPRGIPTISRWRKKSDGSITGLISGSKNFSEGERVTTSPIVKGKVEVGEVVTTGSGSRYFLG